MLDATCEIIWAKIQMGEKEKKLSKLMEKRNICKFSLNLTEHQWESWEWLQCHNQNTKLENGVHPHLSTKTLSVVCLMCRVCVVPRRLLQTLPDKGKKIKEFAEKVRLAIELHDEEERRQSLVSAARTELQSKYRQAFTMQQRAIPNTPAASRQNRQSEAAAGDVVQERESSPASADVQENNTLGEQQDRLVSVAAAGETMETAAAGASLNSHETKEGDLVEALERVRLSETGSGFSSESKGPLNSTARDNYFLRPQIPKKPHYVTVLEKNALTSAPRKQKFKPNQWVDFDNYADFIQ